MRPPWPKVFFDFSLFPWLCFCSKVTLWLPDSLNILLIFLTPSFGKDPPLWTPWNSRKAPFLFQLYLRCSRVCFRTWGVEGGFGGIPSSLKLWHKTRQARASPLLKEASPLVRVEISWMAVCAGVKVFSVFPVDEPRVCTVEWAQGSWRPSILDTLLRA